MHAQLQQRYTMGAHCMGRDCASCVCPTWIGLSLQQQRGTSAVYLKGEVQAHHTSQVTRHTFHTTRLDAARQPTAPPTTCAFAAQQKTVQSPVAEYVNTMMGDCGSGLRVRDLGLGWGMRLDLMLGVWRMSVYLKVYAPGEVPVPLLAAAEARRGNCVANYTVAQVAAAALF